MAEVKLSAHRREDTGKGSARRSRAAGRLPGILYGHGMDPIALEVDRREFVNALNAEAGMNTLLDLQIEGESLLALTRDLQRDPVKGSLLHADFLKIDRTEEIEVEVPVHTVGEAPGVSSGGVLETPLFQLTVRSRATDVPEFVEVDVSGLQLGDSLRVADVPTTNFQIVNDPDEVVVLITTAVTEAEFQEMLEGVTTEVPEDEAATATEIQAEAEAPSSETAGDN